MITVTLFVCFVVNYFADHRLSSLVVEMDGQGDYRLSLAGRIWLVSGPTFMTLNGKVYSTEDGGLVLARVTMDKGVDSLGAWQATSYHYHPAGGDNFPMVATLSTYMDFPVATFTQVKPQSLYGLRLAWDHF